MSGPRVGVTFISGARGREVMQERSMGSNATPIGTALAIGGGWRLQYGGVAVPFNVAIVTSPGALRISFLTGYALRQR